MAQELGAEKAKSTVYHLSCGLPLKGCVNYEILEYFGGDLISPCKILSAETIPAHQDVTGGISGEQIMILRVLINALLIVISFSLNIFPQYAQKLIGLCFSLVIFLIGATSRRDEKRGASQSKERRKMGSCVENIGKISINIYSPIFQINRQVGK